MEENKDNINLGTVHQNVVQYLEKISLNLSHLWLLISIQDKIAVDVPASILATLERKNMVLNGNLTNQGLQVLEKFYKPETIDMETAKKELKKAKTDYNILFLEWWTKYPVGNTWKDETTGRIWKGTRGFRVKQDDCEKLYLKALAEGTKHEDMLNAIDYELKEKKVESKRTGQNKLDYMVNTHSYLLNKLYLNFIEMIKIENWKPKDVENTDTIKGIKPLSNNSQNTMLI